MYEISPQIRSDGKFRKKYHRLARDDSRFFSESPQLFRLPNAYL